MYKIPDAPVCERGNDLIALLYGEIDERAMRDFEQHLLNCADCKFELGAFKQIRSSVGSWRQESLGGAMANSVVTSPAIGKTSGPGKPSALTAIREFFELSPLWMKGSIAFASVLFCLVSVLALVHLFENPIPLVVGDEKRYTEKELQAKIEDAVRSSVQDRKTQKPQLLPDIAGSEQQLEPQRKGTNRASGRVAANPKVRRGPLTRSEREQLAADLRLIPTEDDTDLNLLDDGINQ